MKSFKFATDVIHSTRLPIERFFNFSARYEEPDIINDSIEEPLPDIGLNLNVMSFNIRRGTRRDGKNSWVHRRDLVHEILDTYRPDVLGLQEALDFQMAEVRSMLPGYERVGIGNLGGSRGLHNAVFYDAGRFFRLDEGTFWLSDTPEEPGSRGWGNIIPRICTWVRLIEKDTQQSFYFYNTHLDHLSLHSRKKSAFLLTQRISTRCFPDPIILTGDFNAGEMSVPIQYLKGKIPLKINRKAKASNPVPLMDSFRERYPKMRNVATYHGYDRYFFRLKLDYIFVPTSARVIDAEIIHRHGETCYPSDHFPLIAQVDLPVKMAQSDSLSRFQQTMHSYPSFTSLREFRIF
ncbi:Metal-dependent hydrolase, endonuclease/exonuclease/phosphatase family [Syntrophus gentianae]|uniref:Metal-dependent hydrolase, endonuclease/exonuclease/phosphatase family n=1 Tax=Syntrophus gentianae TaxID=43775 RepID=A0A1H7WNS7_9BACT|nr:endonuclease/exonuclease/phosphatase family protein [Syntrophus gentianae]SEM23236.1 Metal-dependent hydrolase, endonuclease/exonuclease/phosphatase family [Syntrophus gentianae]